MGSHVLLLQIKPTVATWYSRPAEPEPQGRFVLYLPRPHKMRHLVFECCKGLLNLDADANKAPCIKMQMHSSYLHPASKIPKDAIFWLLHCAISR